MRKSNLNNQSNYNEGKQINIEGGYQAADYANLPVSLEVKELFKSIQRYHDLNLGTRHPYRTWTPNLKPLFLTIFLRLERLMLS